MPNIDDQIVDTPARTTIDDEIVEPVKASSTIDDQIVDPAIQPDVPPPPMEPVAPEQRMSVGTSTPREIPEPKLLDQVIDWEGPMKAIKEVGKQAHTFARAGTEKFLQTHGLSSAGDYVAPKGYETAAKIGTKIADVSNKLTSIDPTPPAYRGQVPELIARSGFSGYSGEETLEAMPEKERLKAINQMGGGTGTAVVLGLTQAAAQAPTLAFGGAGTAAKGAKAVVAGTKEAPTVMQAVKNAFLTTAKQTAKEGAAQGFVQGALMGEDPLVGGTVGGLAGGALPPVLEGGAAAIKKVFPKMASLIGRPIPNLKGVLPTESVEKLSQELNSGVHVVQDVPAAEMVPTYGEVLISEDGKKSIQFWDISGENPKAHIMPANTLDEVTKAVNIAQKHNAMILPDNFGQMPADARNLLEFHNQSSIPKPKAVTPGKTLGGRTPKVDTNPLPAIDELPPDPAHVGVFRTPQGKLKFNFIEDASLETDVPAVGDRVVATVAGQKFPGRVLSIGGDEGSITRAYIQYDGLSHATDVPLVALSKETGPAPFQLTNVVEEGAPQPTPSMPWRVQEPQLAPHLEAERIIGEASQRSDEALIPTTVPEDKPLRAGATGYMANGDGTYTTVRVLSGGETQDTLKVLPSDSSTPIQVPKSQIHGEFAPSIRDFGKLKPNEPVPPLPPQYQHFDPDLVGELQAAKNLADAAAKDPTGIGKIYRGFVNGNARGAQDLRSVIRSIQGTRTMQSFRQDLYAAYKAEAPKGTLLSQLDHDWDMVLDGKMTTKELGEKYPKMKQDLLDHIDGYRDRVQRREKRLRELNMLQKDEAPKQLTLSDELGESDDEVYKARQYISNMVKPDRWHRVASEAALQDVVQLLVKEARSMGHEWSVAATTQQLQHALKRGLANAAEQTSGIGGALKRLMERKNIHPSMRKLMGESRSGMLNMSITEGDQESLLATGELMRSLAADNKWSSYGPRPLDLHPEPLPNDPSRFGLLAGMYVHPDIREELLYLPQAMKSGWAWAAGLQSFLKSHIIPYGGPQRWWNSLFQNITGSIAAGGTNMFIPTKWNRDLQEASKLLAAWGKNPLGKDAALLREIKRLGADLADLSDVAMSPISMDFNRDLQQAFKRNGAGDLFTTLDHMFHSTMGAHKKGAAYIGKWHNHQDNIHKVSNILALSRKYQAKGMSEPEALRAAVDRVGKFFWSPKNVGKYVSGANKLAGLVNPFLIGSAEGVRIHANIARELAEEFLGKAPTTVDLPLNVHGQPVNMSLPGMSVRLGAAGAFLGSVFGVNGALRRYNGISDEEAELALNSYTKQSQTYRPATIAAFYRNDKGEPAVLDFTNAALPFQLLRGHVDEPYYQRIMKGLVGGVPFGGSLTESATQAMRERAGISRPEQKYKLLEGEATYKNLFNDLFRAGFGPSYAQQAIDVARQVEKDKLSGVEGVFNMMAPFKTVPGGGMQEFTQAQINNYKEIEELRRQRRTAVRREDFERIDAAIRARIDLLGSQMESAAEVLQRFEESKK